MKLTFVEIWTIFVAVLSLAAAVVRAVIVARRVNEFTRYLKENRPELYPDMNKLVLDCMRGTGGCDDPEIAKFIAFGRRVNRFFNAVYLFFCINVEICILWNVGVRRRFSDANVGTWIVVLILLVLILNIVTFGRYFHTGDSGDGKGEAKKG